jgi:ABC-type polysaccharide/polyol phosphate export permease
MDKSDVTMIVGFTIIMYVFIVFYLWVQNIPLTFHVLGILALIVMFISAFGFLVYCGFSTKKRKTP